MTAVGTWIYSKHVALYLLVHAGSTSGRCKQKPRETREPNPAQATAPDLCENTREGPPGLRLFTTQTSKNRPREIA